MLRSKSDKQNDPVLESRFGVQGVGGELWPSDSNYGFYSALIHQIPELRQLDHWGLLTIPGIPEQRGKILLTERSHFRIRMRASQSHLVYQLAGKILRVGKHQMRVGIPTRTLLQPASTLKARIVTIKNGIDVESFLNTARRQLEALGVKGKLSVVTDQDGTPSRKTIKIQRFTIVGFTTLVTGLSDEDSLILQEEGIGGRRHMGCGYFLPATR
ncbi:type I-MYXAN CRISPR-associated protein Cas6/Cmx6 [Oscillatoria sp. HE19RPO]|uniref:type I-MYXAN CRISPR-associated protein Cas6/Cmx6 n=1 Tax=Oscillatoria sp. HE19RPO TaxID=2954806 RepID=UPI0020C31776|nr:type I-MYXAN CRISPR-associated protein Cas6/Cmx6 [Oscillatoria sp. HE19RPO]